MSLLVTVYEYSSRNAWVQITGVETEKLFAPVPVVKEFFGDNWRSEIDGATYDRFRTSVDAYVEPAAPVVVRNFMVISNNPAHEWIYFEDETEACNFASARNIPVYIPNGPIKKGSESWSIGFGNWD